MGVFIMKRDKVKELLEKIAQRLKEDEERIAALEKEVAELKGETRAQARRQSSDDGFFSTLLAFELIDDIFD